MTMRRTFVGLGLAMTALAAANAAVAQTTTRDCSNCPEMVAIPAGGFTMGSTVEEQAWARAQNPKLSDSDWYRNELNPHRVTLARPFAMGKYAVTRGEYMEFVRETGYALGDCKQVAPVSQQTDRDPMICVSWHDANAYAQWLSRKTGKDYRLPSASEWEYAARAGTSTRFNWGDTVGVGNANCDGCGSQWDNKRPAPVGSFKPNGWGLYEMSGNVWQWTADCYSDDYATTTNDGVAALGLKDCYRVARGGSWNIHTGGVRSATRGWVPDSGRFDYLGFRVARATP
ncbi:MAG: formylglycine-generating enzyme family protein [Telmatospirillum sp.]|nr:formylglycine-generating enzyme family protein [Telmatospirillum sp.]